MLIVNNPTSVTPCGMGVYGCQAYSGKSLKVFTELVFRLINQSQILV